MTKKVGAKSGTKARRTSGRQSAKQTSAKRTTKAQQDKKPSAATVKPTSSRLAAIIQSPTVRNMLAAGLVSAAGALLYNKRSGPSGDSPQDTAQDNQRLDAPVSAAATTGPKPKRLAAARAPKAAPQQLAVAASSTLAEAEVAAKKPRGRPRKKTDVAPAESGSTASAPKLQKGPGGTTRKPLNSRAGAATPPAGIEMPVAGVGETETSAFVFAPKAGTAAAAPSRAPASEES